MSTQDTALIRNEARAKEVFYQDGEEDWKEKQQEKKDDGKPWVKLPVIGEVVFRLSVLEKMGGRAEQDKKPNRAYHYNVFLDYDDAEEFLRDKDKDKKLPPGQLSKTFIREKVRRQLWNMCQSKELYKPS